jgi:lipid II isoglutaminyl synthase (glutamine-hydrolysing)
VAERWRAAAAALPKAAQLVANGDDPQLAAIADAREGSTVYGLDDPRVARPRLQHAADSTHCVRCGTPYDYAAAYVGHLGDYRCATCGHARPRLDVAARNVDLQGLERVEFDLVAPEGHRRVRLALPGLYNVYNAVAAASLARALGVALDDVATGLGRFRAAFGRFERVDVGDRRLLLLLIKNPAGANEVVRTLVDGGPPAIAVLALNDAIADGRDVSWIWDVDFEPLLEGLDHVVVTGDRAAELALRLRYGGLDDAAIEVEPSLERALDRGLGLTPAGAELAVLPTYTAMLALQRLLSERGLAPPYWERAA